RAPGLAALERLRAALPPSVPRAPGAGKTYLILRLNARVPGNSLPATQASSGARRQSQKEDELAPMKRFVSALLALGLMLALAAPAQATITASPNSLAFEAQQDGPSEAKPVKVEVTEDEEAWKVSSLQFVGA